MERVIILVFLTLITFSCGGSLQSNSGVSETSPSAYDRGALVFDPFSKNQSDPIGIPFPNDILLSTTRADEPHLFLDPEKAPNEETKILYQALNKLNLKGFSPVMPIFIPLASKTPLNLDSIKGHYRLIDLTALSSSPELIDQTGRLTYKQEGRYLKFYPVKPLEPGHKYLFLLIKGIKDANGYSLLPPSLFLKLKSDTPLDDQELEKLRESYLPIFSSVLPKLGIEKEQVLELFTFSTANKTLSVKDFGAIKSYLSGETDTLQVTGITYERLEEDYSSIDRGVDQITALILSNSTLGAFLRGKIAQSLFPAFSISKLGELFAQLTALNNGTLSPDQFDLKNFVKFVPVSILNKEFYDGTVYIFQHGLGGNRTQIEALKEDIPLTAVGIDLPFHGDYVKLTENDNKECGEGKCFLTSNPINNRLNVYQAVFNLRLLENLLRKGLYDLNGDNTPDTPAKVNFLGVSMGAIVGSIYSRFGTPDRVVLNVGGGGYSSIVDAASNKLIEELLQNAKVEKNSYAYGYLLGITQLLQDPADPVFLGIDNSTKVIVQSAYGDTVVPNVSNEALAKRVGFDNFTSVTNSSPPSTPGWFMFGNRDNWCIHGFLLHTDITKYPEAEGHLEESKIKTFQELARKQVKEFFSSP